MMLSPIANRSKSMKKKSWLYARFSSAQQNADGRSIDRQVKAAQEWCKTNGVELQETTFADLGVSGWKSVKRPMFEQLLAAIQEGKIPNGSYILFESTDRLSRRGWRHVQELIRNIVVIYDCSLVILDKNQIYTKENINDVVQNIVLMINADLAEKESQRKSDLVAAAYKKKRVDGDITRYPYWIDKTDNGFVLNEHAETVRLIVELRLTGLGALGIASELNKRGIKAPRGVKWGHPTVRSILGNSVLYGNKDFYSTKSVTEVDKKTGQEIRVSKPELVSSIANAFPAICSYQEWKEFQIIGEKRGRKAAVSPFHNILFCSCGGNYSSQRGSGGEKYRRCVHSRVSACERKQKGIRNFDDTLLECLGRITYEAASNVKSELPELTARLEKLEKVKNSLLVAGEVDAIADLYKDISVLKDQIASASKIVALPTMQIKDVFTGSIDEQRIALKRVVQQVVVDRTDNYAVIKVYLTNGHTKTFGINVGTGRGKSGVNTIVFESDTENFKNELLALTAGTEHDVFDDVELVPKTVQ